MFVEAAGVYLFTGFDNFQINQIVSNMNTNALLSPLHCLKYEAVSFLCKSMDKNLFYIPMITPSTQGSQDSKLTSKKNLKLNRSLVKIQEEIKGSTSDIDLEIVKRYLENQELDYYFYSRTKGRKNSLQMKLEKGTSIEHLHTMLI